MPATVPPPADAAAAAVAAVAVAVAVAVAAAGTAKLCRRQLLSCAPMEPGVGARGAATPPRLRLQRVRFDVIDSTNNWAKGHLGELDGEVLTMVTAEHQTAGRGQKDRRWENAEGQSILCTFCCAVNPAAYRPLAEMPFMTQVLALSAVDAVKQQLHAAGVPAAAVGIKWPNDIIVNGHKVGGILAETASRKKDELWVLLGIGINVNTSREELATIQRPLWPPSSLRIECESATDMDKEVLLDALAQNFAIGLAEFGRSGPSPFIERVATSSVLVGKKLTVVAGDEVVDGAQYCGVAEDGALIIKHPNGGERKLYSAEITACHDLE